MFAVDLEDGLIGPETDRGLIGVILGETHRKLPVNILRIRRTDLQLHIDLAATYPIQPNDIRKSNVLMTDFPSPHLLYLPDRLLIQAAIPNRQFSWQAHLPKPRTARCVQVTGIPVLHPTDHDPPAIRRHHRLRRIEVNPIIDRLIRLLMEFLCLLIKSAKQT